MTTQEILRLSQKEIEKMTEKELRASVSILRSTSRKRYERVQQSKVFSSAVKRLQEGAIDGQVLPSIRDLDVTQLRNEYKRYRMFLTSGTSTVIGARKSNEMLRQKTREATGYDIDDVDALLHYYALVDEARKSNVGGALHYSIVKDIVAEVFDKRINDRKANRGDNVTFNEEVLKAVEERLEEVYAEENTPKAVYPSKSVKKRGRRKGRRS